MLTISNYDDQIWLVALEKELDDWLSLMEEDTVEANDCRGDDDDEIEIEDHEDWDEYDTARTFLDECRAYCYDDNAISEDYFDGNYAREIAEELYDIHDHWPFTCIDWDEAAEELKQDYTSIEWEGVTFYVR